MFWMLVYTISIPNMSILCSDIQINFFFSEPVLQVRILGCQSVHHGFCRKS